MLQAGFHQYRPGHRQRAFFDLAAQKRARGLHQPFGDLDDDVAHEPVADDAVAASGKDFIGLDVADKIRHAFFHQLVDILDEIAAFGRLFPDIQKPHGRVRHAHDLPDVHPGHQGRMKQMFRFGVGIGADVDKKRKFLQSGNNKTDGGTLDAGKHPQNE